MRQIELNQMTFKIKERVNSNILSLMRYIWNCCSPFSKYQRHAPEQHFDSDQEDEDFKNMGCFTLFQSVYLVRAVLSTFLRVQSPRS